MTDEEIIDLMYDHATTFSSCVQFSEQGVLDFARAIRDYVPAVAQPKPPAKPPAKPPVYTYDVWEFL